jgi:transposase, IS30 family
LTQERSQRRKFTKWTQKVENYITCAVQLDFSPKQISKTMALDNIEKVSHELIYQFLIEDMNEGGLLYKHLRIKGTNKNKKRCGKKDYRGQRPHRVDIGERPQIVEDRTRIGDWEADLVSGAHHKGLLVTLVDRKTRYTLIGHVSHKRADLVTAEPIRLLKSSYLPVKTITYDNGREFNGHMIVAESLNRKTYFAKPYHSLERGTNENTNGLIRQYFPKGSDLRIVKEVDLQHAMGRINNRPKEVLDYNSPTMFAYGSPRVALAS